jgi:PAS domain S-box-containing protein
MALLALFAALASLSTYRLLQDGRSVAKTLEVLATLEGTLSKALDAETDQRGFVITGDEEYLRPFERAIAETGHRLSRLSRLVADHPGQTARVARLRPLVGERFALMRRTIEARRTERAGAARDLVAAGQGQARMDSIRSIISEMIVAERQILDDRVDQSELSAQVAYVTYAALLVVVLGLLWLVYRVIRRDLAERARVEEALRQSRERFEVAVRGSRDGLWDWDMAADRCYFSPRWKGMLGFEVEEITDDFAAFESLIHPEDRDRVKSTIEDYLQGRLAEYDLEVRLRHKDGSYRWILTRGEALRDSRGIPYRMAGSHTDITARKHAEGLLSEQNRRLEEAARSERQAHEALKLAQSRLVQSERLAGLGQMVAGVAHEINNPLSFVINNAAILGRDVGDLGHLVALYEQADGLIAREDPELHARIAEFRDQVEIEYLLENLAKLLLRSDDGLKRIQQVVKDLRLFARLDEADVKDADLNAGVESSVTIIRGNARREDVMLVLDLGAIPPVPCFPAKINQVILNLLSNAVDACGPGGTVTARTSAEDGWVRVEVADTGGGIDPAIRDRIFDPFFTTKPVGRGTGLGLSISYGIIREHGGTIGVESEPGRGSTFAFRLPTERGDPQAPEAQT